MLPVEKAREYALSLIERARAAGADSADAVYVGSESQSVQVRLGELEHVDRSEGEEMGLRVFVGQQSASVASSDFRPRRSTSWSSAPSPWPVKHPKIATPASLPPS